MSADFALKTQIRSCSAPYIRHDVVIAYYTSDAPQPQSGVSQNSASSSAGYE